MRTIKYINRSFLAVLTTIFAACTTTPEEADYALWVDPYIGAGGHGHVFVGASAPFGMIQAGPQNIHKGWDWCSGYHYSDSVIIGFTHTHLSGTGCTDLGDILVMPFTGEPRTLRGDQNDISNSCASYYKHSNETVSPNYYSLLMDNGIQVELTATERVAMHRYKYPEGEKANVLINLKEGNGDRSTETYLKRLDDQTIEGYRFSRGWAKHKVFFVMKSNLPMKELLVYNNDEPAGSGSLTGEGVKGVVVFDGKKQSLELKVAISSVSCENALKNLEEETPGWDFDRVSGDTRRKWNRELAKIDLVTDSERDKKIFYTALYHTFIAPTTYMDVNKQFRGHDDKVYNADWTNYSTFSLWDTYRALHPLFTILQPERVDDMVNSMLSIYDQQGKLPVWPLIGGETNQMPGYSAVPVIADAYLKGFSGFDAEIAFEDCKNSATYREQNGVPYLLDREYIPCDSVGEATSIAMEYAVDDRGIAAMAKKMGKNDEFTYFEKRSRYYTHYMDSVIGYARPKKADGTFYSPYDPFISVHGVRGHFCEGNGWQYTFFVPQHPEGLIRVLGGDQKFTAKLDSFFLAEGDMGPEASMDISGLIGQYAHGNEPSHHIAYLYSYAGEQWKTAEKVRYIQKHFYTDQTDGIIGNEDCGQMSAWYLLSAMGFYQVNPTKGIYVFGSPLFPQITLRLPGGKQFVIIAENNNDENIYIQSVRLNGSLYKKTYITYGDIMNGGTLQFTMGSQPSRTFGKNQIDRPYSDY